MTAPEMKRAAEEQLAIEVYALRETVKQQGYALAKWGRMLNSLITLLEEENVLTKQEVMLKCTSVCTTPEQWSKQKNRRWKCDDGRGHERPRRRPQLRK